MVVADPDTALAAIKAAGDDFQSLYEAIKKAEFLDATPSRETVPSPPPR